MTNTPEHMPEVDRLKELLLGKAIVAARIAKDEAPDDWSGRGPVGYLTLSDGTNLKVWGNDGGCACSAGCYPLKHLAACDNIITNVEVDERRHSDYDEDPACRTCDAKYYCEEDGHDNTGYYRVFVYAADERINVASFEGSDGNGYYGTGWWLDVVPARAS